MKNLQAQIQKTREKLADLKQQEQAQKLRQKKSSQPARVGGRQPIDEKILVEAVKLAETRTLNYVSLKLNVARSTLYKYGISRKALTEKTR